MKKFKVISAILVLFSALAVTSCSDDAPTLDGNGTASMPTALRVAMGNDLFIADDVTAVVQSGTITITGMRGTGGELVTMTLDETALQLSNPPLSVTPYNNVSMSYITAGSTAEYVNYNPVEERPTGAMVITAVDTANRTISGNFSFVAYKVNDANAEPIVFYSGSFTNVPYTGDQLPEPIPPVPVEPEQPAEGEYYKAKVDGELKEFISPSAIALNGKVNISGMIVSPTSSMNIVVDQNIEPGTYEFNANPDAGATANYQLNTTSYTSQTGTITIESNADGWIKGTFHFTGSNGDDTEEVEITEGQFNVELN